MNRPAQARPKRSPDIEILQYQPTESRSGRERFVVAYMELFNDSDSLNRTSLTLRPYKADAVREWLEEFDEFEHRILIAVDERRHIVGIQTVTMDTDVGYELHRIAVRPDMRRRGIARALVERATDLANELGYRAVDTQVFVDNVPMLILLAKSGFVPVDMLHHSRADGCDVLWLRRTFDTPLPSPVALIPDNGRRVRSTASTGGHGVIRTLMPENVTISECQPAQDPRLLEPLTSACVELFNGGDGVNRMNFTLKSWDHTAVRDWLTDGEEYRCLTAVDGQKKIIGVQIASIEDQEGYVLEALAVGPAWRRRGIGRQLVDQGVAAATELGFHAVDARVFVDNTPMIVLLLGAGFVPVNLRFRARADGCDILWMRKYLGP